MSQHPLRSLLRRLRRVTAAEGDGAVTDAQLLRRFAAARDEAAFELLVWRHGSMVLGLCRRLLRHEEDAEDAFQATFLTLARKARTIRQGEAVAGWLHKVALRVARAARTATARRAAREQAGIDLPSDDPDEIAWRDLRPILDEEVNRLPEKYRAAVVYCYLEGKTTEEAAGLLGCPKGTILSRLSRARERLQARLTRRGVTLSAGALALVAGRSQAALVASLVESTVRAALARAAGKAMAGLVSSRAAELTEGVLRAMLLSKLKVVAGFALLIGMGGMLSASFGRSLLGGDAPAAAGQKTTSPAKAPTPPEDKADSKAARHYREAARRRESQHRLHQIANALHIYAEVNNNLPAPAITDPNGKPLLSWRVAILPYLQDDGLFKLFKLDEPWNSVNNKMLLDRMPMAYVPKDARDANAGMTYYQAVVGKGAGFEAGKALRLPASFPDGLANTLWVAEAATPVEWTKPDDLTYDAGKPLPKFGGLFGGDFNAVFVNGSVHFLSKDADETNLRAAITRAGGETLDTEKILAVKKEGLGDPDDLKDLPRQNQELKKLIERLLKEIEDTKIEFELLQVGAKLGKPIDRKTLEQMKENAKLRDDLDRALNQLDRLQADQERFKERLRKQKEQGSRPKE